MTALDVPGPRVTVEVRAGTRAMVLRGFGELDEQLAVAFITKAATLPASVPIVLDLSELTLARTPVLQSLLQELLGWGGDRPRPAVVVCRRLSARRMVRHAAGPLPVAVVATLDEALGSGAAKSTGNDSPSPARAVPRGGDGSGTTGLSDRILVNPTPSATEPPVRSARPHVDAVVVPFDGKEGGDYYDVIPVGPVATAISLVDAAGYGPPAAELGSRLRSPEYHESLRRGEPAAALAALDRALAEHLEVFATAICAVWCPASRHVRMANAGHIPPVVISGHDAAFLAESAHPPLGLATSRWASEREMPPGAALVFCTDGLVERRWRSLDHGLTVLRSVLSRRLPEETSARSVLDDMIDALGPLEDDATVVVARPRIERPGG